VQFLNRLSSGVSGEAAIADHLRGYALCRFLAPAFDCLQIAMAVRVDEARRDGEAGAIDYFRIGRLRNDAHLGNAIAFDEKIAVFCRDARAIDDLCVLEEPPHYEFIAVAGAASDS
jgi:hypothetical protein